ncbi:MAG: hypothetical protein IH984_08015 [Planctomycetes bacterium]|nr:hypothetical protein [Planctomycetota bacterium]
MSPQLKSQIGTILCRGVVPAWVASGAIVKLIEATPKLLPEKTVLSLGKMLDQEMGISLMTLLASLIAIEFVCIAVMVLLQKYARAAAIFILSVFCIVLIGEMVQGNITKCGCFGGFSPTPWAMLIADGSLLFGVLFFRTTHKSAAQSPKWPMPSAVVLSLSLIGLSFGVIISAGKAPESNGNGSPVVHDDPTINPNPAPLKGLWYTPNDMNEWVGKPWRELEIFQFMPIWPSNMDDGKHYVVFYRRTCDHCEEMFYDDLTDPDLAAMVTAIEVPEEKDQMRPEDRAWPLPDTDCELLELSIGCDWLIQSPLTIRVEDGIITCAVEGGHKECMELGPEDH